MTVARTLRILNVKTILPTQVNVNTASLTSNVQTLILDTAFDNLEVGDQIRIVDNSTESDNEVETITSVFQF